MSANEEPKKEEPKEEPKQKSPFDMNDEEFAIWREKYLDEAWLIWLFGGFTKGK